MEEFALEPGERITRSVRKHWIVLVWKLIPYALLAALPFGIPYAETFAIAHATSAQASMVTNTLMQAAPWLRLLLAFWWLFLWVSAFSIFTKYCLTQWVITTTRIVDIHQYGFFSRQVSSFLLNRVQDVTTEVNGILQTVFGFGTLNVETAGRDEKFQMNGIQHPVVLRDLIMAEVAALHADGQLPPNGV